MSYIRQLWCRVGSIPVRSSQQRLNSTRPNAEIHEENRLVHVEQQFEAVPPLSRNKKSFMAAIALFKERKGRSHVEFINTALKYVKEYGVHKDLDTYKALLNVFPKGKMIPRNTFQRIFLHFPMQQNCCVKVLDELEWNGVQPDKEIHDIVVNAFGEWNFATKKVKRMMYWMPKLKYSNKYLDRRTVEGKDLKASELAGIALKMISRDPGANFSLVQYPSTEDDFDSILDLPWVAISQSNVQRQLLSEFPAGTEVFLDGPFTVFVMDKCVPYCTLTTAPALTPASDFKEDDWFDEDYSNWFSKWEAGRKDRRRTIHEQNHETILALGALYRYDNKVGMSWIEELQKRNSQLEKLNLRSRLEKPADSLNIKRRIFQERNIVL